MILFFNHTEHNYVVERGERVAQLIVEAIQQPTPFEIQTRYTTAEATDLHTQLIKRPGLLNDSKKPLGEQVCEDEASCKKDVTATRTAVKTTRGANGLGSTNKITKTV